jgi:predicted Zn-ribbon and HTH transcriptional regulator
MVIMAEKEKLTKWQQLKMKSKVVRKVDLELADGEIFPIEVQSVSQATLDAIDQKYDDMKNPRPQQFIKEVKKHVDFPEDSKEYIQWKKEERAIDSLRIAEKALAFLVEKPSGETTEEQIKELKETIRPGDFIKIVMEGHRACGYEFDEDKINTAKNS